MRCSCEINSRTITRIHLKPNGNEMIFEINKIKLTHTYYVYKNICGKIENEIKNKEGEFWKLR